MSQYELATGRRRRSKRYREPGDLLFLIGMSISVGSLICLGVGVVGLLFGK